MGFHTKGGGGRGSKHAVEWAASQASQRENLRGSCPGGGQEWQSPECLGALPTLAPKLQLGSAIAFETLLRRFVHWEWMEIRIGSLLRGGRSWGIGDKCMPKRELGHEGDAVPALERQNAAIAWQC